MEYLAAVQLEWSASSFPGSDRVYQVTYFGTVEADRVRIRGKSKVCYGKEEIIMRITKGDKTVSIPAWAVVIGLLVVDNVVVNVCKTVGISKLAKSEKKEES